MADYLDDSARLEDALLESLVLLAKVLREEVDQRMPSADAASSREAVTALLWGVAATLNGRVFSKTSDGRDMLVTLGIVVRGSESAFEQPFIEHEGLLLAGRISLTDYVHTAVERAFG